MQLGIIIQHTSDNIEEKFIRAKEMGFTTCQLSSNSQELRTQEQVNLLLNWCEKYNVTITAVIGGWSGPSVWDFYQGPITLGLVPQAYRDNRINELKQAIDFANLLGVSDVNTHIGFIPENPNDANYNEVVSAVKYLCYYAKNKNVSFCVETGQETPITLLRLIEDTHADNIGVNLDPANLLMYGKANPIDALDIIGKYVKGVHGKDGDYPTNPRQLGNEKPIGDGRVNFNVFISKLKECGYDGAITIEREISGKQQENDILLARDVISKIINTL